MDNDKRSEKISVFFPVYRDERTVRQVTEKALRVLSEIAEEYEVIIVDDCSPDRAGQIADELAASNPRVRVLHHSTNLGYGSAIRSGLEAARYPWICFTDGDDEYDLEDLHKLWKVKDFYDLIITFRYVKLYSGLRIFISWCYNVIFRRLFHTQYRDISTGLRLIRKSLVDDLRLESTSPFIGAEITVKTMLKGYRVGEVGIQTFPREFGKGSSTSVRNIRATIRDMLRIYGRIFSTEYELPPGRQR